MPETTAIIKTYMKLLLSLSQSESRQNQQNPAGIFSILLRQFFRLKPKKAAKLPEEGSLTAFYRRKSCQNRLTAVATVMKKPALSRLQNVVFDDSTIKMADSKIGQSIWLRRQDLNLRPSGYEPDELPDCSTPRYFRALRSGAYLLYTRRRIVKHFFKKVETISGPLQPMPR